MKYALLVLTFFSVALSRAQAPTTRTYWRVPLDSLAIGHYHHTHIAVTGRVLAVRREADGDVHINLGSPAGRFVVAECIPALPCATLPKVGATITVKGISRRDPEHGWYEVHPLESWEIAK